MFVLAGGKRRVHIAVTFFEDVHVPTLKVELGGVPHGLGPQVAAPIPFYLQAIGSISEVQLRIC